MGERLRRWNFRFQSFKIFLTYPVQMTTKDISLFLFGIEFNCFANSTPYLVGNFLAPVMASPYLMLFGTKLTLFAAPLRKSLPYLVKKLKNTKIQKNWVAVHKVHRSKLYCSLTGNHNKQTTRNLEFWISLIVVFQNQVFETFRTHFPSNVEIGSFL